MNSVTKRFYYRFITLYLISSLGLLVVASFYFYHSKVSMETQKEYYKLIHTADMIALQIIDAHMHHKVFVLSQPKESVIALFDKDRVLRFGKVLQKVDFTKDFYTKNGVTTVVSQGSAMHLGIKYVAIQTKELSEHILSIRNSILLWSTIIAIIIIKIAICLSYLFLKPIKQKMEEIERFVKDSAHELNTPISSLMMSLERLKSKKVYDERIISNISISVKNLKNLYDALNFISFKHSHEDKEVDFKEIIEQEVLFFEELVMKKSLHLRLELESKKLFIAPIKAKMLLNNLLSNAIKYSKPKGEIRIRLDASKLVIEDKGIGIAKEQLRDVFKRFQRANSYAGGFGVGLDIVKNICDEYGIEVTIFSQEHQGTKVVLRFNKE